MTIIVVSFNTRVLTLACLKSIQTFEPNARVIVVDNDSRDGSGEAITNQYPGVKVIRLEQNIGFGRANCVGLRGVDDDFVVLLNSDACLIDGSLSYCVGRVKSSETLAGVTPRLVGTDGSEQAHRHAVPSFYCALRRAIFGVPLIPDPNDYWIPGTCLVLDRRAVESSGGLFKRDLFMYWEDADLCARLKARGFHLGCVDEAMVIHHGGASGGGPNCTAKSGLHEWYTFGRHRWYQIHRPRWESAALWILELVDAFRCMARGLIREGRTAEWQYGLTLLKTLIRLPWGLAPTFAISPSFGRRDEEFAVFDRIQQPIPTLNTRVGVVVIGRNEGERLRACLASLSSTGLPVVYVDSGSTDGSQQVAREHDVRLVELDMQVPFTAGRARNAGLQVLLDEFPDCDSVQFIDGDCILHRDWLPAAIKVLNADKSIAIVCGPLREAHPEKSVYNQLCQMEWRRPLGKIAACGGIFLMRASVLRASGGFNESLIAGEEPELCLRVRQSGYQIESIPQMMAQHDAGMTRFGQWWKRSVRSGFAYANGYWLHRNEPGNYRVRELRSIVLWGLVLPLAAISTCLLTDGVSLVLLLIAYWLLIRKISNQLVLRGETPRDARLYSRFIVFGKFSQGVGVVKWLVDHLRKSRPQIIEYK